MANIFLRTSRYVAAFMRSDGDGNSLSPKTPIVLSPYTVESVVLANGLRVIPESQQHRASCYSQFAWNNMLRGRLPQGGKPIISRDANEYLTYAEICTLERLSNKTKTGAYEFLCISLPREICIDGRVERVSSSHTLETSAARELRRLLRNRFIRAFLDFETKNSIFAADKKIHRSNVEVLERFLMKYDIPVSHDKKEREGLRRLIHRWRKEAGLLVRDPVLIEDGEITRIDEHEIRGGLPKYSDD